jgi:hypothetical protein
MNADSLTPTDRARFRAARARGETQALDASALVDARYDRTSDAVLLTFRGGGSMAIPRRVIPGLERTHAPDLESMTLSPAGDALLWPAFDVDVYVPALVERAFGSRLFAAAAGRRGGQKRTTAKTAAARRNGAKGGRPRKRDST